MAGPFSNLEDRFKELEDDGRRPGGNPPTAPPTEQTAFIEIKPLPVIKPPNSRVASKIEFGNPQTTDYSVSMEYKNYYGGGTSLTGKLATGIHSGIGIYDNLSSVEIKKRTPNFDNFGASLGEGKFTLESLYNKNHTPNLDRAPIQYGQTTINTIRAGMGTLSNLDIQGYSSNEIAYRGDDRGEEPYFISEIGSDGYDGSSQRSSILKFYKSPAGLSSILKENATNYFYRRANQWAGVDKLLFPAVPAVRNVSTFLTNQGLGVGQADAFASDLGGTVASLRNIFRVEYSKRPNYGLPFANLGDKFSTKPISSNNTVITQAANDLGLTRIKNQSLKIPFTKGPDGKNKELLVNAGDWASNAVNFIDSKIKLPLKQVRRNPFYDLSGGPSNSDLLQLVGLAGDGSHNRKAFNNLSGTPNLRIHGYEDDISNSGVIRSIGTDDEGNDLIPEDVPIIGVKTAPGDFYVRFKDLRDNKYIYFRGYVTGITENLSPSWNAVDYVGRSESVYMYQKADRDVSFNLKVYPNNQEQFNAMYLKMEKLTSLVYPEYLDDGNRLTRMKPPFTELYMAHIGDRKKGQFGYIKSLSYTVNESGDWDANQALPRLFDIAVSYQILSKRPPSMDQGSMNNGLKAFYGGGNNG